MNKPALEQIEEYVKEKGLFVEPKFFMDYFEAGNWHDSKGKQVKSWKQKLWTWHRKRIERGVTVKCYCGKPGVYVAGYDNAGMATWRCVDHKPKPKGQKLPEKMTNVIKLVPEPVNVNNARNKAKDALGIK